MDGIGQIGVAAGDEAMPATAVEGGKRSRKRDSLFLSARLSFGTETAIYDVRVRNLSAGGLMAELERMIEPGTTVRLEMRGLGEMSGHVAWCAHGRLGISLDQQIDPARARKPVGAGKRTPQFAKPLTVAARPR